LLHAVVAILVELSVFAKIVDAIKGCELNVVIPLKVEVDLSEPIVTTPPDKLVPIFIVEFIKVPCKLFVINVPRIVVDIFIFPKVRPPVPPLDKLDPIVIGTVLVWALISFVRIPPVKY